MKKHIHVFTDGSCKGNPGPGGWAAILLEKEGEKPFTILKGHEGDTTNNRMEMIAVIEALRYLHEHHLQNHEITLYSDSNLVIQTLRKGWKRKANLDLWEELDELHEELSVEFIWVRGHDANRWNNECDKIARSEAERRFPSMLGHSDILLQTKKKFAKPTPYSKKFRTQQQKLF